MKGTRQGDFTRLRRSGDDTSTVRMQQGRVQLDADWNEALEVLDRRLRDGALDLVGPAGAPAGDPGFAVSPRDLALEVGTGGHFLLIGGADGFELPEEPSGGLRVEARVVVFADGRLLSLWRRPPERRKFRAVWALTLESGRLTLRRPGGDDVVSRRLDIASGEVRTVAVDLTPETATVWLDGRSVATGDGGDLPEGPLSVMLGSHDDPAFRGLACRAAVDGLAPQNDGEGSGNGPSNGAASHGGASDGGASNGGGSNGDGTGSAAPLPPRAVRWGAWHFTEPSGGDGVSDEEFERQSPDVRFPGEGAIDAPAVVRGGGGRSPRWLPLDLGLGPGRFYAGGVLCRLAAPVSYRRQPDLPGATLPVPSGLRTEHHVVYLDVWERTVAAAEDPRLLEPALNGADTVTHGRLVSQVRTVPWRDDGSVEQADGGGEDGALGSPRVATVQGSWTPAVPPLEERGRLAARRGQPVAEELDNVLYRVEVHDGGGEAGTATWDGKTLALDSWDAGWREGDGVELASAGGEAHIASVTVVDGKGEHLTLSGAEDIPKDTALEVRRLPRFKWSRHNAAVLFPVAQASGAVVELAPSGRDMDGLEVGAIVELVDAATAVQARPAGLHRVVSLDPSRHRVTLEPPLASDGEGGGDNGVRAGRRALRLWDQRGEDVGPGGAVTAVPDRWLLLERGVEVCFRGGGDYRIGDYWWIPARTATGEVDWPDGPEGRPLAQPPEGVEHAAAPLALLSYTREGFRLADLRNTFHPHAVDAVRKAGDWMDGNLELRADLSVAGDADVVGQLRADTLRGRLLTRGAVGAGQIRHGAVELRSLASDVGVVPEDGAILLRQRRALPGYVDSGWVVKAEREEPAWNDRAVLPHPEPGPLVDVAVSGRIHTLLESGEVWSYDPADDVWQGGRGLPEPLQGFAAAALDGHIYVAGGLDGLGSPSERLLRYDPESGDWVELAPLPTPRSHLALVACQGRLHALGGWEPAWLGPKVSRRHEIYEPGLDAWTATRRHSLPRGIAEASAVAVGDRIHLAGGEGRTWFGRWGTYLTGAHRVYRDGGDERWSSVASLALPRRRVGLAPVDDHVAVVGGEGAQGWTDDCELYDPASNTWRSLPRLHRIIAAPGVTGAAGTLYVTGAPSSDGRGVLMETCAVLGRFHVYRRETGTEEAPDRAEAAGPRDV